MSKHTPKLSLKIMALTLLGSAAFIVTGCSDQRTAKETAQDTVAATKETAKDTVNATKDIATDVKNVAVNTWDSIKNYTYEKKSDFADGIDRLAQATDEKIKALPEKTSGARATAVQEYQDARAALKSSLTDLREASADTWDAAKEKTNQAWKRVQAAYENAKDNATS